MTAAVEACKIAKEIGDYSKEKQDARVRLERCIKLAPNDLDQTQACRRQYLYGEE